MNPTDSGPIRGLIPQRQPVHRGVLVARAAVIGAAFIVAVGLAEVVVRVLMPAAPLMRFQQLDDDLAGQTETYRFMDLIEPDPELFWRFAPDRTLPDVVGKPFRGLISNRQGLREDHPIPPDKPSGEIRILFLGDSCTFGLFLNHGSSFVQKTEDRLRARFAKLSIECINAGVPGYSLFQGWRFLESKGITYEPDLVVLAFGNNDNTLWDGRSDMDHFAALKRSTPPQALGWSRLCQAIWRLRDRGDCGGGGARRGRLMTTEFRDLLRSAEGSARRCGADLLLFVSGNRSNLQRPARFDLGFQIEQYGFGKLREFGPRSEPAYVDGAVVVQQLNLQLPADGIFFDNIHPTAVAHEAIAEALAEKITPWLKARRHE